MVCGRASNRRKRTSREPRGRSAWPVAIGETVESRAQEEGVHVRGPCRPGMGAMALGYIIVCGPQLFFFEGEGSHIPNDSARRVEYESVKFRCRRRR